MSAMMATSNPDKRVWNGQFTRNEVVVEKRAEQVRRVESSNAVKPFTSLFIQLNAPVAYTAWLCCRELSFAIKHQPVLLQLSDI